MAAQTKGVRVSGLDGFLYSLVGEQRNGTPLTVLSAFAQLGLDPWQEAARLAQLPRDEAARDLASLIGRLPRPVELPDKRALVSRLTELLPDLEPVESEGAQRSWTTLRMWVAMGAILLIKPLVAVALLSGGPGATGNSAPVSLSFEPFPSRSIQLIVSASESGPSGAVARLISEKLASVVGQPVATEVHPALAAGPLVAQAEPDGHTLLVADTAEAAIDRLEFRAAEFDPGRDFQPIALVSVAPLAVAVPASSPWNTMSELVASSRSSGLGLSLVSAEPGTPEYMVGEMLRSRTQIRFAEGHRGGGTVDDLLIGRADVCLCSLPTLLPHVASGTLRVIAVLSSKRSLALPHVPTAAEDPAFRGVDGTSWVGIFAPHGTPPALAVRINSEINRILGQPEVREQLLSRGADLMPMSVDDFSRFVRAERKKYADLTKEAFCVKTPVAGCSGFGSL
jgi:tripartite-type tricarboxylate transporter receptor subunit TctC